tara:strand:+ start:963 stop:3566 length:2604 start_codon:yes stop_codon:yes gene_type:complete
MTPQKTNLNTIFILLMLLLSPIMGQETLETYQLNNGLNVILLKDNTAEIVTAKAIVGVGSIYEKEYLGTGISHYLEHIVAGGSTEKNSEDAYKLDLSLMGGVSNAYTTTDHTAYYINTTPQQAHNAIKTLHEWLFYCSFKESEVSREKDVITREIEKTSSNIQRQFYYLSQENTYLNHPSQLPVIGYIDKFKTVTKTDLELFYQRNYVPANMTLIIGGPISIKEIKQNIDDTFAIEKRLPKPTFQNNAETKPFNPRQSKKEMEMNSTLISLRFPTIDLYSEDLYALDLLDYILGNGNQSILTKKLVEELKIAYSVSASSYTPPYTKGFFEIVIDTDEKHINQVIDETLTIIQTSKEKEFSKKRIERSKKQKLAENILSITSIENKTTRLAMSFLYSKTTNFFDVYANNFKQISAKDVKKIAQKYFNTNHLITTIGVPKKEKNKKESNKISQKKEEIKKITLKNGLRIIFHPNTQAKSTKIQIMTKGGILSETEANNGIGNLTAKLIGTATNKYSKEKIESIIENNGASMSATSGYHTLYYTLDCLKEDTKTLAPLFFHTFFEATFKDTYIKEEKRKQTNIIKQRNDDWFSYGNYTFKKQFWGNHPYSLSSLGELESIKQLTSSDFTTYHKRLLNPKNMIISIMGNYNEDSILNLIEKNPFNTEKPNQSTKTFTNKTNNKITHLNHKFETTSFFMGFQGTSLLNETEKVKLDILDTLLSGASYPGGRLHNKLRDKGFVYVVHGISFNGLNTGSFYIYALTNEESWDDVNNLILSEIKSLQEKPASDQEWDEAIARLKFYYKDRASSTDSIILLKAVNELLLNDMNHSNKIDSIIDSITKEMIMEAAKKYFIKPETIIFHPNKDTVSSN